MWRATLFRAGSYYCFDACEEFHDPEEEELIRDLIESGCDMCSLQYAVDRGLDCIGKDHHREILEFTPLTLTLRPNGDSFDCHAFFELDSASITYLLPRNVRDCLFTFYEATGLPEPNINAAVPNYGEQYDRALRAQADREIEGREEEQDERLQYESEDDDKVIDPLLGPPKPTGELTARKT